MPSSKHTAGAGGFYRCLGTFLLSLSTRTKRHLAGGRSAGCRWQSFPGMDGRQLADQQRQFRRKKLAGSGSQRPPRRAKCLPQRLLLAFAPSTPMPATSTAADLSVECRLPAGMSFSWASPWPDQIAGDTLRWFPGNLAAGAQQSISIQSVLDASLAANQVQN